jgi:hypothetical protein
VRETEIEVVYLVVALEREIDFGDGGCPGAQEQETSISEEEYLVAWGQEIDSLVCHLDAFPYYFLVVHYNSRRHK